MQKSKIVAFYYWVTNSNLTQKNQEKTFETFHIKRRFKFVAYKIASVVIVTSDEYLFGE
jgi:hypothetical protein